MSPRVAALALALAGCGTTYGAASGPLSAPPMLRDIAALSDPRLDGRDAGHDGERDAARYVADRLLRLGLTPVEQDVPYGMSPSRNVYAVIAGSRDEVIVVGAHLDHLGRQAGVLYPGADDNASGVAVVLALAETLAAQPGREGRTVIVAFFGAEERGLVGSRHFAAHPPVPRDKIRAMVNLDMVARPLLDQLRYRPALYLAGIDRDASTGLVGARHYPGLRALADAAFGSDGAALVAAEDLPDVIGREVERQSEGRSDSASFEAAGIPSLFFGDGESSDYHRPSDTIDTLHPDLLARRAAAITRVVVALTAAPDAAFTASDDPPPKRTPATGWYLPFGVATGVALHPRAGALIGGDVSLVHLASESLVFAGVSADALHDTATGDALRVTIGPELGRFGLGVDAGYVAALDGHRVAHQGAAVRVFGSLAAVSLTARLGVLTGEGWYGELGVAFKLPWRLTRN